jgi:hypothetical protein
METLNRLTNNADTAIKAYNFVKKSINYFSPEYQLGSYLLNQFSNTSNMSNSTTLALPLNKGGRMIQFKKARRTRRRVKSTRRNFLPNAPRGNLTRTGYPKVANSQIGVQTAPVSAGFSLPTSYYKRSSGSAQQGVDIGGMEDNERIYFSDLYTGVIDTAASGTGAWNGAYYAFLSPTSISSRLGNITGIYQYYAIREVTFTYIPAVSTAMGGLLGFSIYQDVDGLATTAPTLQEVLEVSPSMTTPVWGTASMTYRHTGTRLWETSSENTIASDQYIQGLVWGVVFNGQASTTYGRMHVSGVIDVYKISFILSSLARMALNQARRDKEFKQALDVVNRRKEEDKKKLEDERNIHLLEDISSSDGMSKDDFENLLQSDSTAVV